jgi:hypothetical protein
MDEKVPNLENEKEDLNYNIFQKSKSIFIKFNNDKKIKLRTIDISKIFNLYKIKEKEIINYILFPKYKKINILDEILSLKEQGNLKIKENIDEAIKKYDEAIKIIYDYEDSEKKDSNILKQVIYQKKLILSNKSQMLLKQKKYVPSIEIDKYIIENVDNKFDKSYARLISNYLSLDNISDAKYYSEQMKNLFNKEILDKYNDIFNRLKQKEEEKNSFLKTFYKKSKKNENKTIQNYKENLINESNQKKQKNFWKMVFHSTMFIGSGIALYILYKKRSNFI